ncbi:MAG: GNAT family N-acetyltransferase [Bdellovibrionales bacterium]|nr:GNAT family N-acetyltransferase [Bdellovibrionales bacterium]
MIRGKNVLLRALEKEDLAFLHELHNSQETMNYFFEEPYETYRELEDLFEKHIHNQTERRFVIEERSTSKPVGVLSLIEIDEINRRCEIDIIIENSHQGKGYGKQGFVLGVKYAFDILNLYKVYLLLAPSNFRGMKIYEYIGFTHECRLRNEYYINGEYVDVVRMCIFDYEWRQARLRLQNDIGFSNDSLKGEVLKQEKQEELIVT